MCYSGVTVDELAKQIDLSCKSWPRLSLKWPVDWCVPECCWCSKRADSLIAFKASLARAEQTQSVDLSWRTSWLASLHWYGGLAKIGTELLFRLLLWNPCLEVFAAPIQGWQFDWAFDSGLLKFGFGLQACLSAYHVRLSLRPISLYLKRLVQKSWVYALSGHWGSILPLTHQLLSWSFWLL